MTACRYDIHGVPLTIDAPDGPVTAAIDRRLRAFRTSAPPVPGGLTMGIETGVGPAPPPPVGLGPGRSVVDTPEGPLAYDEGRDVVWLDFGGRAWLLVEAATGRARLWAAGADEEADWLVSHPLLTLALTELLKRRQRYPLHAAALSRSGGGVALFAGASGAGKTTLAVGLLLEGWDFLADDTVLLGPDDSGGGNDGTDGHGEDDGYGGTDGHGEDDGHGESDGPAVLGFPDEIDVTDATLALFPALGPVPVSTSVPGRDKRPLSIEETFGRQARRRGPAVALFFPEVAGRSRSTVTAVEPGDALAALAPNVVLTDPASTQAHLDALAGLVARVPAWRLETGRDFRYLDRLLAEVVEDRPSRAGDSSGVTAPVG